MGCGASASTNNERPVLLSDANRRNILLASHSSLRTASEGIRQGLLKEGFSCYLLDEETPRSLSNRAEIIQWSDLFVVVINRLYQRTFSCMEAFNYAKDIRKPIVSILAEATFQPYGALGAISASAIQSMVMKEERSTVRALADVAQTQVKHTDKIPVLFKVKMLEKINDPLSS